jgi:sugar lactone lactonase YvrE
MVVNRLVWIALAAAAVHGQPSYAPPNDLPNPYSKGMSFASLPDGRKWGSTAGVDIGPDGHIWAYDRCAANACTTSDLDPVIEFDPSGKTLHHFGKGLFVQPHGFFVDKDSNVWVTDAQASGNKGFTVVKFNRDGKVLMTIGKPGVAGLGPDTLTEPTDVLVAPNGTIFISVGHSQRYGDARILKYSKDGKFISAWGTAGAGPGQFVGPHSLAMDSKGRLFVADRTNNRIEIFDKDGKFLAEWKQFGRPSGLYIDKKDMLYVTDSESNETQGNYGYNPGCKRGIRIGSAKTGKVMYYIPDPDPKGATSTSEGVAADKYGNVYGAEVGPRDLKKYTKSSTIPTARQVAASR